MKKIFISATMIIIMLFNIISVSAASGKNAYPESQHNYSGNFYGEWYYTHEDDADCLFVTFSEDTYFGPGGENYSDEDWYEYGCDYLIIYDEYEEKTYYADELAGKTVVVSGSSFGITFSTNGSGNYYGFKITDISTQGNLGEYVSVTYEIDENNIQTQICTLTDDGSFPVLDELKNRIFNDKAIIGWKDDKGHEYIYNNNSTEVEDEDGFYYTEYAEQYTNVFELKPGDSVVLTPVYTSVSIKPEETFFFDNSGFFFEDGYKMTDAHAKQMRKCYQSATWKNSFGIIGVPLGALLPPIYQNVSWSGSCCGFPIAILMQHYGMIDLLNGQGAHHLSTVTPTEEIISALNFYNAVTPAAIICSHKAKTPGTDEYKSQIKNLYETVKGGKPVICFIHCGYIKNMSFNSVFGMMAGLIKGAITNGIASTIRSFANTHCILLTGAYTDGAGNRVFIGYDENDASYAHGRPQIYTVKGDFEDITPTRSLSSLGSIAWFDDVSFLESFKADGETDPSAWYSYYKANKDTL